SPASCWNQRVQDQGSSPIVDAKRFQGRPELRVEGGILRPRVEKLFVGGRDRTRLIDGVIKQVELVRSLVDPVPVTGALCFVDASWPLFGGAFTTRGIHVVWPRRLVTSLTEVTDGPVDVASVSAATAARFAAA
ncbi:MAG: NERD domain-containing protein, partial [Cellulomonadaceae bacterium]